MRKLIFIERLSHAIVKNAVLEYRSLLKRCGTWQRYRADDSVERKELENFFYSRWCVLLTEDNGVAIMEILQREAFGAEETSKGRDCGGG